MSNRVEFPILLSPFLLRRGSRRRCHDLIDETLSLFLSTFNNLAMVDPVFTANAALNPVRTSSSVQVFTVLKIQCNLGISSQFRTTAHVQRTGLDLFDTGYVFDSDLHATVHKIPMFTYCNTSSRVVILRCRVVNNLVSASPAGRLAFQLKSFRCANTWINNADFGVLNHRNLVNCKWMIIV